MPNPKVLLVDDEERVLAALTRELIEQDFCEIVKAQNAAEALELLQTTPDFYVVCSDFRMPGMDGVSFLAKAQQSNPDTIRILLTGAASLETAIDAVNRGKVFRFLLKPCPSDLFIGAIKAGIRQYELVHAEQDLLSKTLNACIKIMMDILAAETPEIFSQSIRLRTLARDLAKMCQLNQVWQVEIAAMLSQIGAITLPPKVLSRWRNGNELSELEQQMIDTIPHIGCQLVTNIPRLEEIATAIDYQDCPYQGNSRPFSGEAIPIAARIIKIVLDFDRLKLTTNDPYRIFPEMARHPENYDPAILEVFRQQVNTILVSDPYYFEKSHNTGKRKVPVDELEPGMVLAKNIIDRSGRLVIAKGTIITDVIKFRLVHFFWSQPMAEPIYVESNP